MTDFIGNSQSNPAIRELVSYQPGKPIAALAREYGIPEGQIIKLASNENPLGMSPKARAALEGVLPELYRYPEQHDLVHAVARHTRIQPEQVVLGNGSNDVLDIIARTFLYPGRNAVSAQYAFAIYQIATQSAGAQNIIVPAPDYAHDLNGLHAAVSSTTNIIWIANPNNPTGTFEPYDRVKSFLEKVPRRVLVVLDEAYYDYLPPEYRADTSRWLAKHPNLILVRTFSKIHGLAGLRVGYGLASPEIAELLNRVRQPFNVSTGAVAAATAALSDRAFVSRSYQANRQSIAQLRRGLTKLGLHMLPAHGNFITFRPGTAARTAATNESLLRQGVIVRPLAAYGMPEFLRVTAGTPAENERFLQALSISS